MPPLEHAEITLDGVGGHVAPGVFPATVHDSFVSRIIDANRLVELAFVGMETALLGDVLADDLRDVRLGRVVKVEGSNRAAALDKGDDGSLGATARSTALSVRGFPALRRDVGVLHLA